MADRSLTTIACDRSDPAPPSTSVSSLLAAAVLALMFAPMAAWAQSAPQPLPGLIVTVPGNPVPQPPPVAPQPAPAPPQAQPKPKTAPKSAAAATSRKAPVGAPGSTPGTSVGTGIVVLVNDEPITAYELDERARLLALQTNIGERASANMQSLVRSEATSQRWRKIVEQTIQQNQTKSRDQIMAILEQRKAAFGNELREQAMASARASAMPGARKAALDELIDERLKLQEAKRLNVAPDDGEVDKVVNGIAERNKMSPVQFAQHLKKMGGDITAMRAKFRTTLGWNEVVRRKFGNQVSINERDIERFVEKGGKSEETTELQITRITIPLGALDQRALAARLDEADRIRRQVKGCKGAAVQAVAVVPSARTEDLGWRSPKSIPEPARTLLLNAQDGEMVPPNPTTNSIELYALCQRRTVTIAEDKRNEAQSELRQREFELHAKRLLKNLREDAHLEWRDARYAKRTAGAVNAAN